MTTYTPVSPLIAPYGGSLVDLMVPAEAREEVKARASQLSSLQLSERSVCDLELLATGAFSPLDRFMGQADHQRILDEMRLSNGQLFPVPIPLPVDARPALHLDCDIALRDAKNDLLAVMTIEEIYAWDLAEVAQGAPRSRCRSRGATYGAPTAARVVPTGSSSSAPWPSRRSCWSPWARACSSVCPSGRRRSCSRCRPRSPTAR